MYIGIDAHKDMDCVLKTDEKGEVVGKEKIEHSMQSWDKLFRAVPKEDTKIAIEAGTYGIPLYKHLKKQGFEMHMAHPKEFRRRIGSKKKTDWEDCIALVQLLRVGLLPESYVPDDEIEQIRILTRCRVSLGQKRTMIKNQIHALLGIQGMTHKFSDLFGISGKKFLQKLRLPTITRLVLESHLREIGMIEEEIKLIETKIAKVGKKDKKAKLLMSIPGVDFYSAVTILSEIGDIKRFPDYKKLVAYAGLAPRIYESNKTKRHGHITKEGPGILRWMLISDAHSAVRWQTGKLKRFYERLKKRIGKNKAIVATAKKLLIIIYRMLTENKEYEERDDDLTYRKIKRMKMIAKKKMPTSDERMRMRQLAQLGIKTLISEENNHHLQGSSSFS